MGGIGPQATMDFEQRVHRACQALVPQAINAGYPPMVVYYCRFEPWAGRDGENRNRPNPRLLEAAEIVGRAADFVVITSNATHRFAPHIAEVSGREVLSMIDAVLGQVREQGWTRVGVLGFGEPLVYTEQLEPLGIAYETIDGQLRDNLDAAIPRLMEGREDDEARRAARDAVEELRSRGVDAIVLGCTEIPFLLGDDAEAPDLVDPLRLLVDAAVARATAG